MAAPAPIAGIDALPAGLRGGVVAIGNFDGVHRGHRAVLEPALRIAARKACPALVLTFEPHPRSFFNPGTPVFRLTPAAARTELLYGMGFSGVIVQPFDAAFSRISAGDFVERLLVERMAIGDVVVGADFHFGAKRQGTPAFLAEMAARSGFGVTRVPPLRDAGGTIISSSRIRDALAQGDIALATALLGRHWRVDGTVIAGRRLGRELGFPTANMALPEATGLRHGVYAVRALLPGRDGPVDGVASFGRRPTFDNGAVLLETFLFDFDAALYGQTISVEFHAFLRDEAKFDDTTALVAQMHRDAARARESLADDSRT